MLDLSTEGLKKNCPHCDFNSFAFKYPLEETTDFRVVCDVHPLTEGHILIIPKTHLSCIGEFNKKLIDEFIKLYQKYSQFLKKEYGRIAVFEHGKLGQTVFHSHVHLFPFNGNVSDIIPEGMSYLTKLADISQLRDVFRKNGQYLFLGVGDKLWLIDTKLGKIRFFRDRFAYALGNPQRGDWKKMHKDKEIIAVIEKEITALKLKWQKYFHKNPNFYGKD